MREQMMGPLMSPGRQFIAHNLTSVIHLITIVGDPEAIIFVGREEVVAWCFGGEVTITLDLAAYGWPSREVGEDVRLIEAIRRLLRPPEVLLDDVDADAYFTRGMGRFATGVSVVHGEPPVRHNQKRVRD